MGKRYFTVDEANAMVPLLEATLGRVLQLRAQLRAVARVLEGLGEPISEGSLRRRGGSPELLGARARARGLYETLDDEMAALRDTGVELKDLDTGLCDFVARREGRDVYLCWRLGEKQVGHWHELSAGFAGRQPLSGTAPRALH